MTSVAETKGITFKNKNLKTEDFYSVRDLDDKTFDMVAQQLWMRLVSKDRNLPPRGNETQRAERFPIQFRYFRDSQAHTITGATFVLDFVAETGVREIEYYYDTMGGR